MLGLSEKGIALGVTCIHMTTGIQISETKRLPKPVHWSLAFNPQSSGQIPLLPDHRPVIPAENKEIG
jgi:hypothetical protein